MGVLSFELLKGGSTTSKARRGLLHTQHGSVQTPVFMPVGTLGTVKGLNQQQLVEDVNAQIILGNTYHLYLRPGTEILKQAGGLHRFIGWDRPLLTDSGGYQVYSLAHRRKISEEGVTFASHIDGSSHFFSPEFAIDIQRTIGADIIMAFDECTPYPCDRRYAERSMQLTHRWLERCVTHFNATQPWYDFSQTLAPIVQGSIYSDLRRQSAQNVSAHGAVVNAIGGLSVGEPVEMLYEISDLVCSELPVDRARYLMGVGTPANILECIAVGVDMFDCVLPTRNARHGLIYTTEGVLNIKNRKWATCHDPIDAQGSCEASQKYSRAYLRHLIISKELLGAQLASLQNLTFYHDLLCKAREMIDLDRFESWKSDIMPHLTNRL